ncbi:MAG: SulP family inorganic anion transporter [Akkermansiaceae bacterium]|nr:SulP family inorganic anion transporter [Armatimonadota bacterium]
MSDDARPPKADAPKPKDAPLSFWQNLFAHDLVASFVVFLIAIPLSLGIALASGAPILAGLIAGVVGGIVVGALGGSPLQVSGPAAGLTVIVAETISRFGWATTATIVVCAGLIQIAFGFLKIARAALAISPAVVHGMLAGIGVVITLAQLHVVLGGKPESNAFANIKALPAQVMDLHAPSAILGVATIAFLFAWTKAPAVLRKIPGSLIAVVVGTIASQFMHFPTNLRVDLPDNLRAGHIGPQLPALSDWNNILIAAATIAIVASVESLLSAVAVDKISGGTRANLDRELIGQGAGNTLSGLLGGLPVTGVIVRSSTNVNAGAKTRASAILHGVWILVFVLVAATLLEMIPLSVLAGLLVFVGVNLVSPAHIREMLHNREWPIYFTTLLAVVFLNLLEGVAIGIGLAVIFLLRRLAKIHIDIEEQGDRWHARIEGSLTFLSVPALTARLAEIPPGVAVDIDLMVDFMDHAAFEALHSWRAVQEKSGGKVDLDELHEAWYESAEGGDPKRDRSRSQLVSRRPEAVVPASAEI